MNKELEQIREEMLNQDNHLTESPLFIVFEKKKVTSSPFHSDDYVWVGEDGEEYKDENELIEHIKEYEELEEDEVPTINDYENEIIIKGSEYRKWYYQEIDVFVQPFFTKKSAQEYIDYNSYNLRKPYIFAISLYGNYEMIQVRNAIINLTKSNYKPIPKTEEEEQTPETKTYVVFDSIKQDPDLGLMFGCYCKNSQMEDAVISLLGVSILGKRITKFTSENEIMYIGFEDRCPDSIAKRILKDKSFIIFHKDRDFVNIIEDDGEF